MANEYIPNTGETVADDLGGIARLNGSGRVSPVPQGTGVNFTGALSAYGIGGDAFYDMAENYGLPLHDIETLIHNYSNITDDYHVSLFTYNGLPKELTKFKIEAKLLANGAVCIIKLIDKLYAVNVAFKKYDMYGMPIDGVIIEPRSDLFNGKSINKFKWKLLRNNWRFEPNKTGIYVWISKLIEAYSKLIINVDIMKPNAILADTGSIAENDDNQKAIDKKLKSKNIFHTWRRKKDTLNKPNDTLPSEQNDIFTDINVTTYADDLIKIFNFIKSQFKELIGGSISSADEETNERLITAQLDNKQDISVSKLTHMLEIRQIDLTEINDEFGTNITIEPNAKQEHAELNDTKNEGNNDEQRT